MCGLKFHKIFIKAFVIEYLTACLDCNVGTLESLLHNNTFLSYNLCLSV